MMKEFFYRHNGTMLSASSTAAGVAVAFLLLFVALTDAIAQPAWEFSLQQRRMHDQIHVEVWARAQSPNVPRLGEASLVVQYNADALQARTSVASTLISRTDSVSSNLDQVNPVVEVQSVIRASDGYRPLTTASYGVNGSIGYHSLEVRRDAFDGLGFVPIDTGRGAFIGKLVFDIRQGANDPANPDSTLFTGVQFGQLAVPPGNVVIIASTGDTAVGNINANPAVIAFQQQPNFPVVGITVLNPRIEGQVVDRDKRYASTTSAVVGNVANPTFGYPLYFERSGFNINTGATPLNRFQVEYSRDGGQGWIEIGRVAEGVAPVADIATLLSNAVPNSLASYEAAGQVASVLRASAGPAPIAFQTTGIEANRGILRTVIATRDDYPFRSEDARFRISRLSSNLANPLAVAPARTIRDISARFLLGKLFFLQFDGITEHVRTDSLFSNATQLTAEAWVNLNQDYGIGSSPGIIASSPGPTSEAGEGTWMLYLHNGRFPAFRVREILGRGENGYIATIISDLPLDVAQAAAPLGAAHQNNWMHLAATVSNDTVTLYVNGEIIARRTNNSAADIRMGVNGNPGTYPIWLGVNPNVAATGQAIPQNQFFPGGIKEARIWRIALPQDSIRRKVAGVFNPTNVGENNVPSLRKGLEMYFTLEGSNRDIASNQAFQRGAANARFFREGQLLGEAAMPFRPDLPHLRLTVPKGCEGFSNAADSAYTIRWVGFGLTNTFTIPNDVTLEFSLNGVSYFPALATADPTSNRANFEGSTAIWRPSLSPQLANINPFSESVRLRVRGNTLADTLYSNVSNIFAVAPHFSLRRGAATQMKVRDGSRFVMGGQEMFMEAWIRPHVFPAEGQSIPIITKADSISGQIYYALDLQPNGRLRFRIRDTQGNLRTALSADSLPLRVVRPNTIALDSAWTHVGVYVNRGSNTQTTRVLFYTDGMPHAAQEVTGQLGEFFLTENINGSPLYIGSRPAVIEQIAGEDGLEATVVEAAGGFIGNIREVRFWSGRPNNSSIAGNEPTAMTNYIRGALAVRARDITQRANLIAAFSLDGSDFPDPIQYKFAIGATTLPGEPRVNLEYSFVSIPDFCFEPTRPYIKIVEPIFGQRVSLSASELKVRWVGFDYIASATRRDGTPFAGSTATSPIEVSFQGGGGNILQPYSHIVNVAGQPAAFTLSETPAFRFPLTTVGGGNGVQFAGNLNPSIANPFVAGANLSGALLNARLRYLTRTGTVSFNGSAIDSISSESNLFTVVPPSNFTVRVLLEGYHGGTTSPTILANLGTTFDNGGLRIKLYRDINGQRGELLRTAESELGYLNYITNNAVRISTNRAEPNSVFANVPFVFTDVPDGAYWVVVEHRNHLPIMSRFAAPFDFTGDNLATTNIESGWDFTTWGGAGVTPELTSPLGFAQLNQPTSNGNGGQNWLAQGLYSAFGNFVANGEGANAETFSRTALIFNNGRAGTQLAAAGGLPAMVAGDVDRGDESRDVINAFDRQKVRRDAGTTNFESDVTGDGVVNATDRDIVDRNTGRVSSLLLETFVGGEAGDGEETVVFSSMPDSPQELTLAHLHQYEQERFGGEGTQAPSAATQSAADAILQTVAGISYTITAEPEVSGQFLSVPIYIENTGAPFALGHATFAINYDNAVLEFIGLGTASPVFSTPSGYQPMQYTPNPQSTNQVPGVASIEVVYDRVTRPQVPNVPNAKTLVGTLRFRTVATGVPYVFDWNRATVVHRTDGDLLTGTFDFREGNGRFTPIRPIIGFSVDLINPSCRGEIPVAAQTTIRWINNGASTLNIEYSANNGETWTQINDEPVNAGLLSYQWTAPSQPTAMGFVRLLDVTTGLELSRNSCAFSVVAPSAGFTNPAAGAVYRCNTTEVIRWNATAAGRVRIEFFDGFTWTVAASDINAANGSFLFSFPNNVVTSVARFRMISLADNSIIGTSPEFTVLCGSFDFITPSANQLVAVGEVMTIEWFAEGIQAIDLQFSPNNGASWQTIMTNVNVSQRRALWIPTTITNLAVLRAIAPGMPDFVYATSPRFRVDEGVSVEENVTSSFNLLGVPAPNPAAAFVTQKFSLRAASVVDIEVFSVTGMKVLSVVKGAFYNEGTYTISYSVESLAAGTYFVRYTVGGDTFTQTLVVRR